MCPNLCIQHILLNICNGLGPILSPGDTAVNEPSQTLLLMEMFVQREWEEEEVNQKLGREAKAKSQQREVGFVTKIK